MHLNPRKYNRFIKAWQRSLALVPISLLFTVHRSHSQTPEALPPPAIDRAWSMLTSAAAPDKSENDRIQAMAALGTMGVDPRAEALIHTAITGHDIEVRTAAIPPSSTEPATPQPPATPTPTP